jgi:hypothetical protein
LYSKSDLCLEWIAKISCLLRSDNTHLALNIDAAVLILDIEGP